MSATVDSSVGSCPSTLILLRTRNGLSAFRGPSSELAAEPSISRISGVVDGISGIRLAPHYTPDGSLLCVVQEVGNIIFYDSISGLVVGEIDCPDTSYVEFSPKGGYMITFSKPVKGSADGVSEGNLKVWNVATKLLVVAYSQKVFKKETIQFSADESLCYRIVTNEVHVLNGSDLAAGIKCKLYHKGISQFKVSPTVSPFSTIAVFNSETGGNPAKVTLYSYHPNTNEMNGPVSGRTMFAASEASMAWNCTGSAVLVHTHCDVDKSNSSYYGSSGLFLLSADGSLSASVPQSKEGQIHDVQWSPLGDRFVVAAGNMPCHVTLFDSKAQSVFEFGAAHRNCISYSPHGRFLLLAGFGNLAGEMDFYDMLRLRKIGSNTAHCSVTYGWSPCSRYFMCATLAPRMNVENGFKLFKYNGTGPVVHHEVEQAFDAIWRPAKTGVYPSRGPSPRRDGETSVSGKGSAVQTPVVVQAYRPPGSSSRGGATDLKRLGFDTGSVQGKTGVSTGSKARLVPGMAQPVADPAKALAKKEADKKKKAEKDEERRKKDEEAELEAEATAAAAAAALVPVDLTALSAEEKEKRIKAVKKKLKAVDEVKSKRDSGTKLDAGQIAKLGTEEDLLRDLALLSL